MKKTIALMLVMVLSAMVLLGEAINMSTQASDLCCDDLAYCRGPECCVGPGIVNGCAIECESGAMVVCRKLIEDDAE